MGKRKIAAVLLIMLIMLQGISVKAEEISGNGMTKEELELEQLIEESVKGLKEISGSTKMNVLSDKEVFQAGSSICDWIAIALAFSEEKDAYEDYRTRLEAYVTDCYKEKGCLDEVAATTYQKCVLTILALGGDPLSFGTDTEGNSINILAEGTYYFKGESLGAQGLTGYIYALIALDTKQYPIPEDAVYTRADILSAILESQSEDGGFSLSGNGNDVDITAMALQALAPYKGQPEVDVSIEKALEWLSEEMTQYGTFVSGNAESCESTAQVIQAMCALDLDVTGNARFQKNGMTPWDGLEQFRLEDGTYVHTLEEQKGNLIATEQALLTLEAVQKRVQQDSWLLDYTTYELSEEQCTDGNSIGAAGIIGIGVVVVLVIVIAGVVLNKKKGKRNEHA